MSLGAEANVLSVPHWLLRAQGPTPAVQLTGTPRCPPPRLITLRGPGREGWGATEVLILRLQILL